MGKRKHHSEYARFKKSLKRIVAKNNRHHIVIQSVIDIGIQTEQVLPRNDVGTQTDQREYHTEQALPSYEDVVLNPNGALWERMGEDAYLEMYPTHPMTYKPFNRGRRRRCGQQ